jgi:hypothetical protein
MFLLIAVPGDELVLCPHCSTRFDPDEEELLDPEDD